VTSELPAGVAGPSFGSAPRSAGFLCFGSLAVNSKMLSRANHGADDANMPATIIAHTPVAITILRRVILMAETSCLTVLLQNTIYHPVTEVHHDHALNSSTFRTVRTSDSAPLIPGTKSERQSGSSLRSVVRPRSHGSSKKAFNWAASPARIILSIGLIVSLPIILPPRI
jgi:hypothetical protein